MRRIGRGKKALPYAAAGLLLALVLFAFVYPSPVDPAAWKPPAMPKPSGALQENRLLRDSELLADGELFHPEDIAFDAGGRLYTGTQDGKINRIAFRENGEVDNVETYAVTGGYPLGLQFDGEGNLIAAVKSVGLVSIDRQGSVTLLTDKVDGSPIRYADELDIASDGMIYFSDGSTKFEWGFPFDTLEGKPYGRLLGYNPATGATSLLLDNLYFANGVVLAPDEQSLLITESPRYRITRYWLHGERANEAEVFADNLPILPDNISLDQEGDYWVGGSKRTDFLDRLQQNAFLKKQIAKLPFGFLRGIPDWDANRYGYVIRLSADGRIKRTYQDPGGERVYAVSAVERRGDELYIGTLYGEAIARYPLDR